MVKHRGLIRRGQIVQILFILLLLALLAAILLTEIGRNAAAVLRQQVAFTTYREQRTLSGYVFRDEEVLLTTNNGPVEYLAADGSLWASDSEVARVYLDERGTDARERASALYDRIAFLEQSLQAPTGEWQTEYLNAYAAAMATLEQGELRAGALAAGALSLSLRQVQTATATEQQRAEIEAEIAALRDEIQYLIRYVADQPQILHNELEGAFYRATDGYETLFGKQAIDTLTPEELAQRLASGQPAPNAVGKVIDRGCFYLAVPVASAELAPYTVGQSYPVCFLRGGGTVQMMLERISFSVDQAEALLILQGQSMPDGADLSRRQEVCITVAVHEGLSLPRSAVYEENGASFVFVEKDGTAQKRWVEITLCRDGVVLIAPREEQDYLAAGDQVLLAVRRINEGQAIRS